MELALLIVVVSLMGLAKATLWFLFGLALAVEPTDFNKRWD